MRLMGWWIGLATLVSAVIYATHSTGSSPAGSSGSSFRQSHFYIGPCFGLLLNLAEPRMRAVFCAATLFRGKRRQSNRGARWGVGLLSDWFAPGHVV